MNRTLLCAAFVAVAATSALAQPAKTNKRSVVGLWQHQSNGGGTTMYFLGKGKFQSQETLAGGKGVSIKPGKYTLTGKDLTVVFDIYGRDLALLNLPKSYKATKKEKYRFDGSSLTFVSSTVYFKQKDGSKPGVIQKDAGENPVVFKQPKN